MKKFAILLDGGFVRKILQKRLGKPPTADDVENECRRIESHDLLKDHDLLRIYFYDAPPAVEAITNPVDSKVLNLGNTHVAALSDCWDSYLRRSDKEIRRGRVFCCSDSERVP